MCRAPESPWALCTGPGVTAWSSTCIHACAHATHVHTHTHAPPHPLPFWYQGRNQGQGTLAVLLGSVSGQHENLSKVRLQTSSAEGRDGTVASASPVQEAGCQAPHQHLSPQSPSCWDPALALTCGCGQAAHVAVALLAVRLPSLEEEICDLGRGALGTPGSVTRALPMGATMPCQAATPAQGRPQASTG